LFNGFGDVGVAVCAGSDAGDEADAGFYVTGVFDKAGYGHVRAIVGWRLGVSGVGDGSLPFV
jgi:hypothetical protein